VWGGLRLLCRVRCGLKDVCVGVCVNSHSDFVNCTWEDNRSYSNNGQHAYLFNAQMGIYPPLLPGQPGFEMSEGFGTTSSIEPLPPWAPRPVLVVPSPPAAPPLAASPPPPSPPPPGAVMEQSVVPEDDGKLFGLDIDALGLPEWGFYALVGVGMIILILLGYLLCFPAAPKIEDDVEFKDPQASYVIAPPSRNTVTPVARIRRSPQPSYAHDDGSTVG
jgi:hypothetical protein